MNFKCFTTYMLAVLCMPHQVAAEYNPEEYRRVSEEMIQILSAEGNGWGDHMEQLKQRNNEFYQYALNEIYRVRRETGNDPEAGHIKYLGFNDIVLKRAVQLGLKEDPEPHELARCLANLVSIDRGGKMMGDTSGQIFELLLKKSDFSRNGVLTQALPKFSEEQRLRIYQRAGEQMDGNDASKDDCTNFLLVAHRKEESDACKKSISTILEKIGVNAEKKTEEYNEEWREIKLVESQIGQATTDEERKALILKVRQLTLEKMRKDIERESALK